MSTLIIAAMIVTVIVIVAADVLSGPRRDAQTGERRSLERAGQALRRFAAGFRSIRYR